MTSHHHIKYDKNNNPFSNKAQKCDSCRILSIQRIDVKIEGRIYKLCPYCHGEVRKNSLQSEQKIDTVMV
uniref:Uncharacterized protein n=1 Tax=viral metagenome TaxID=1070528 RepID=A0A6H2A628_9ZZZZ